MSVLAQSWQVDGERTWNGLWRRRGDVASDGGDGVAGDMGDTQETSMRGDRWCEYGVWACRGCGDEVDGWLGEER